MRNSLSKKPLQFSIYADSEADIGIDKSKIGNKTSNINKQNPVSNGYHIVYELGDILQSRFYDFPLSYDNVDWFADEVTRLQNKIIFYFINTSKDINMFEEDEELYRNNKVCRFCKKTIESDTVRGYCHKGSLYRAPAYNKCILNVT